MAYLTKANADKVLHTDIFFDPQSHTTRGLSFDTVVDAITQALADAGKEFGISSILIPNFLRHLDADSAMNALDQVIAYMKKVPAEKHQIIGVGLDSSELGNPPNKFAAVFARAREVGLKVCVHTSEEGPPGYIIDA
jgi:adenosine deaminase